MKYLNLIILGLILTLVSCATESEKGDVISMEDFAGETGLIENGSKDSTNSDSTLVGGVLSDFISSQLGGFDTVSQTIIHPIDRFSYNQKMKLEFKSKVDVPYGKNQTVTPHADFYYYSFSDSTKTKNAFYNWLDCFTPECEQVKLNESFESLKMPPAFAIVYDTVIIAANYRCEDAKFNWKPFQDSIVLKFGDDFRYQFSVGCGGPLNWK